MLEINPRTILNEVKDLAWLSSSIKDKLISVSKVMLYDARDMVFQGKDSSENIYIIISGEIKILSLEDDQESLVSVLYDKSVFGLSFLYGRSYPHIHLAIAANSTLVLEIPINKILKEIPSCSDTERLYGMLVEYYQAYKFIKRSTSLGDQLSPIFLIEFVSAFETKVYKDKAIIFNQNDEPDGYYICLKGQVEVIVEVKGNVVFRALLKEGDYFGELALTTNSKRSGTVLSLGDSECLFLSKAIFNELVEKEPQLLEGFKLLAKLAYG
jgi:CRP-like cAMP-binding protein